MNRPRNAVLILAASIFLLACRTGIPESEVPTSLRTITLHRSDDGSSASDDRSAVPDTASDSISLSPLIELDPVDSLIRIVNIDLDTDGTMEQILAVNNREQSQDPIRIELVDFDVERGLYFVAWKMPTSITNELSFDLLVEDLTGDHDPEIVCRGTDLNGFQAMNVFSRRIQNSSTNIAYQAIADIAVERSIEIQRIPRSIEYDAGGPGEPFPIAALSHDPNSVDPNALTRQIYGWDQESGIYALLMTEAYEISDTSEQELASLFTGGPDETVGFLAGPWRIVTGAPIPTDQAMIAFFDPEENPEEEQAIGKILFYRGDTIESFTWTRMRQSYRLLSLEVRHDILNTEVAWITVTINDLNTLDIRMYQHEEIEGVYTRLSTSIQRNLVTSTVAPARLSSLELRGAYTNNAGGEIDFEMPRFRRIRGENVESGGYALYTFHDEILSLRRMESDGRRGEAENFRIEYEETVELTRTVRRIVLTPVLITVYGVTELLEDPQYYEQIVDTSAASPPTAPIS